MSLQAALIICGLTILVSFLGLVGLWQPFLLGILFLALILEVSFQVCKVFIDIFSQNKWRIFHIFLLILFIFTIIFHFIGVFLPETGFDALWYHLPLIQRYVEHHQLIYTADFYQSLYPQYGDGLLLLGFSVWGVLGAKLVSFLFFLLLINTVYFWLREKLSVVDTLIGTLMLCFFQVVSWQSSSAYVDLISAVFFLWLAKFLSKSKESKRPNFQLILGALSCGIFLGTKFVNLGFLPLLLLLSTITLFIGNQFFKDKVKKFSTFWIILASVALPWYIRAWWFTGSLIYPIGTIYAVPVIEQMGVSGWSEWLAVRLRAVWRLPIEFFFKNDGYVTPLLLFFSPVLLLKKNWSKEVLLGFITGLYGLMFWFFFPPPSTRYVLGLIIVLWIMVFQQIILTFRKTKFVHFIRIICLMNIIAFFALRLFINTRAIPYLLGQETQQQYLNRFRNGFTDEKINAFYGKQE